MAKTVITFDPKEEADLLMGWFETVSFDKPSQGIPKVDYPTDAEEEGGGDSETKDFDFELELKVRHVRTPAGERRFGQPIGSIIVRDGHVLQNIKIGKPKYSGFQHVTDKNGREYDVGKHDGKWIATQSGTWNTVVSADSEEGVYEALDKHVGGGRSARTEAVATSARAARTAKPAATPKATPSAATSKYRVAKSEYPAYDKYIGDDGLSYYGAVDKASGEYVILDARDNEISAGPDKVRALSKLDSHIKPKRTTASKPAPAPKTTKPSAASNADGLDGMSLSELRSLARTELSTGSKLTTRASIISALRTMRAKPPTARGTHLDTARRAAPKSGSKLTPAQQRQVDKIVNAGGSTVGRDLDRYVTRLQDRGQNDSADLVKARADKWRAERYSGNRGDAREADSRGIERAAKNPKPNMGHPDLVANKKPTESAALGHVTPPVNVVKRKTHQMLPGMKIRIPEPMHREPMMGGDGSKGSEWHEVGMVVNARGVSWSRQNMAPAAGMYHIYDTHGRLLTQLSPNTQMETDADHVANMAEARNKAPKIVSVDLGYGARERAQALIPSRHAIENEGAPEPIMTTRFGRETGQLDPLDPNYGLPSEMERLKNRQEYYRSLGNGVYSEGVLKDDIDKLQKRIDDINAERLKEGSPNAAPAKRAESRANAASKPTVSRPTESALDPVVPARDALDMDAFDKMKAAERMHGSDERSWPKQIQRDMTRLRMRAYGELAPEGVVYQLANELTQRFPATTKPSRAWHGDEKPLVDTLRSLAIRYEKNELTLNQIRESLNRLAINNSGSAHGKMVSDFARVLDKARPKRKYDDLILELKVVLEHLEEKRGFIRTEAGARRYKLPIGSPIPEGGSRMRVPELDQGKPVRQMPPKRAKLTPEMAEHRDGFRKLQRRFNDYPMLGKVAKEIADRISDGRIADEATLNAQIRDALSPDVVALLFSRVKGDEFWDFEAKEIQDIIECKGDEPHTGAMIALIPTTDDAMRLAAEGGEDPSELHTTLRYLGKASNISQDARESILQNVGRLAYGQMGHIQTRAFGLNIFNPEGDEPCVVVGIGDGDDRKTLSWMQPGVIGALENVNAETGFENQESHTPWVPHVTLRYFTDGPIDTDWLQKQYPKANGTVTFDRIRVAFGDVNVDFPINDVSDQKQPASEDAAMKRLVWAACTKSISADDRRKMGKSGEAMPNGDFPIPDEDHLRSAIRLLGRYKGDQDAAKAHIKKRARALGMEDMLPDDWDSKAMVITPGGRVGDDSSHNRSPRHNWVEDRGGLPPYIRTIRNGIMREHGDMDEDRATALAVSAVERWAAGRGNVSAKVRAAAAKAVARWEAMKASKSLEGDVLGKSAPSQAGSGDYLAGRMAQAHQSNLGSQQAVDDFNAKHPRDSGKFASKPGRGKRKRDSAHTLTEGLAKKLPAKYGQQSPVIQQIQVVLKTLGFDVQDDGIYGDKTTAAVKQFQKQSGLKDTGEVDVPTMEAMLNRARQGAGSSRKRK